MIALCEEQIKIQHSTKYICRSLQKKNIIYLFQNTNTVDFQIHTTNSSPDTHLA